MASGSPVPETQLLLKDSRPFIDFFRQSSLTKGESVEFRSAVPRTHKLLKGSQHFIDRHSSSSR
ncbi:hypothetical protein COLO4_35720 [Corchorus olitorius]|uniref:Uncharacterized protein n=1 Tax=Corchorus olitorius TaxID=93759 RepID=A0A1R3GDS2_9ROSI|nr:hypothetical protein COLO4_35720 [Corchorus olitorius]